MLERDREEERGHLERERQRYGEIMCVCVREKGREWERKRENDIERDFNICSRQVESIVELLKMGQKDYHWN